jgi:Fur family ferric uptake transcriptional regulator
MVYNTRQREEIWRIVESTDRPLTAPEICALAGRAIPKLGMATVYRTIKNLVEEGQMRAVEVPGATPHYESAGRHHHHFFLCQKCRHLFPLAGCVRGLNAMAPEGFRVQRHEIVLYGECAGCQSAA